MQIGTNAVVEMTYSMRDEHSNLLVDISGYAPILYLHGAGNLIPELEAGLEGLESGDIREIMVAKPIVELASAVKAGATSEDVGLDSGIYRFNIKVVSVRSATPAELAAGFPIPESACGCKPGCC